jgi:protoporphyrinogen oxidase
MADAVRVVVVGGGIAGIVAATEAARAGASVVVLEAASSCGGLLRSVQAPQGEVFDYGTHLLTETGRADLDERYIRVWSADEVVRSPHLLPGGYSFGTLRPRGMWMDWSSAEPRAHARWFRGLVAAADSPPTMPASAADLLRVRFGQDALTEAFLPVLRKLQGAEPDELAPDVVKLFGLQRVATLTPEASRLLKHDPVFDDRLAFHDCAEKHRERAVIYPSRGGMGAWVQRLLERAQALGVRFATGCAIQRLLYSGSRVTAVETATHGIVPCDRLVWTIPPHLLLQATAEPFAADRPRMLTTVLVHLVCDSAPTVESQFVTCFDPEMQNFRVTLYSNFRPISAGRYPVTVEFLTSSDRSTSLQVDTALHELLEMGVLPSGTRVLDSRRDVQVAGFPVLTCNFVAQGERLARQVQSRFGNVFLAGKARGQDFFMLDVMARVVDELSPWLESHAIN